MSIVGVFVWHVDVQPFSLPIHRRCPSLRLLFLTPPAPCRTTTGGGRYITTLVFAAAPNPSNPGILNSLDSLMPDLSQAGFSSLAFLRECRADHSASSRGRGMCMRGGDMCVPG
jgi:hypothetical protein